MPLLLPYKPAAQPANILLDHYTIASGLASNSIWEICKSRKGFIWLGTQDGLCRFDGKNFRTYRYSANDSNTLSHNAVYSLLEDEDGYIWAGTFSGLNRYDPRTNSITRVNDGTYISSKMNSAAIGAIAQTMPDKTIWAGTSKGLFFVNKKTLLLDSAKGPVNKEVFGDGGRIFSLLAESPERIWIGSDKGLILYNAKSGNYSVFYSWQKNLHAGSYDYQIKKMMLDKKGTLWIASWGLGLLAFDTAQKKFTGQYLADKNDGFKGGTNIFYSLAQTNFPGQEDIIWLACNGTSLTAFNTQTKKFVSYKSANSDSKNGVYGAAFSLFFDTSDGLWAGSEKGLYHYDMRLQVFNEHPFTYAFQNACLSYVYDAYPEPTDTTGNTIWVGTWNCGLFKYNLATNEFSETPDWLRTQLKPGTPYNVILRDNQGILWAGTTGQGLLAINEKEKAITHFYPPDNKPASVSSIYFLQEDKEGRLWTGTPYGLFVLDAERKKFDKIKCKITDTTLKLSNIISGLCIDNSGNTWFTAQNNYNEALPVIGMIKKGESEAALFYYQRGNKLSFPDVKVVNNIICDNNNTIWCASWNGLLSWKADDDKPLFKIYTSDDGLINNRINKIAADAAGNIWCGTGSGLSVLMEGNKKFRNFNNSGLELEYIDGIFFNRQKKNLLIADWAKIHTIIPADIISETAPPRVTITDFRVFNKQAPEVKEYIFDSSNISLASNRNVITIDFAALTFYNQSQVQYAYKMEGVDDDWIYTGNNSVTYNLSNGKYFFRVKAANAEGVWNNEGVYMKIIIRAPFWKQSWFIALAVLAVTGILYSIYRYRINQLKKVQNIRNNISRDLHDDIGATLSNINILNELAQRNIQQPEKSKKYMDTAAEHIQRVNESLSDIVWNINPQYDDLQNLFIRMKRYAADMLDGKNINGHFDFPAADKDLKLGMERRRDFYLLFKEAVNNLAKYSKASNAWINISIESNIIKLLIKDDGRGFDMQQVKNGNGLHNMQQRAAIWSGTVSVQSAPGKGTTILVQMPVT